MRYAIFLAIAIATLLFESFIFTPEQHAASRTLSSSIEAVINTAPVAVEDSYKPPGRFMPILIAAPGVLANDQDADSDILTAELVSASNPIDEPGNFVCQQYHDFLHRQPDDEGLAFWTNQITQCGTDQSCIDEMRHNVAMAFFLSIEFQQRGYFAERLYEACLSKRPSYREFIRDLQRIGVGVVVGAPGWEVLLENNTRDFAEHFVQRTDFIL
ncbi:MAG TPA: DUF4214 domain-containing protein, partial [Pyrinomonadaceae bacterium]